MVPANHAWISASAMNPTAVRSDSASSAYNCIMYLPYLTLDIMAKDFCTFRFQPCSGCFEEPENSALGLASVADVGTLQLLETRVYLLLHSFHFGRLMKHDYLKPKYSQRIRFILFGEQPCTAKNAMNSN